MKHLAAPVTIFALAAPIAVWPTSHPVLAALLSTATGGRPHSIAVGALVVGIVAGMWAGRAMWTVYARAHQHRRHEWLDAAVDRFDVAILLTDVRGTITTMNGAAESMTGWRKVDAVGQPVGAVFQLVDRCSHARVVNPVVKALYKDLVVDLSAEALLMTKDGTARPVCGTAAPIRDGQGRVMGCAQTLRDREDAVCEGQRIKIAESGR
jgi:PAS domain S-box-containing protein